MKYSKATNLTTYFNGFFRGTDNSQREQEMITAIKLAEEFKLYIDALARMNPHRFHHIYEWGQVGSADGRLFAINIIPAGNSVVIRYELLKSVVPNENGQVFTDKAEVMESGKHVTFETDKPVPIGDGEFRTGSFTFKPGGDDTTNSFKETYYQFFVAKRNMTVDTRSGSIVPSGFSQSSGYRDGRRFYDRVRIK